MHVHNTKPWLTLSYPVHQLPLLNLALRLFMLESRVQ